MLSEESILNILDNSDDGTYGHFVELGHGYYYLIDTRLNVFRNQADKWAIAIEKLAYNPRAGNIILEINYYGNCLINLEEYNNRKTNYYQAYPVDWDSLQGATDGEYLVSDAKTLLVRGQKLSLNHNKEEYIKAGIELAEYNPLTIRVEAAARLLVIKHRAIFRATDEELYKSIPKELEKLLVLDEWYHREYLLSYHHRLSHEDLVRTYEANKAIGGVGGIDLATFIAIAKRQEIIQDEWNLQQWEENRPSSYETWQMIAKVIVTGDV